MHAFCSDFPEPCLHFVCWNHQGKKADKKGSALQQCRHTRQVALTSASLHVTRAVLCYQGDPVSSCTDLNVTTLSAARPSYFSTWRVAFFKVGGERFGFGLGFSPPPPLPDVAADECACQDAWREEPQQRVGTPAPAQATNLCRQGKQAAAAGLPVSHRYTPSRRAPHFLYHGITPKGCLGQAHPLLSSILHTPAAPNGSNPAVCCAKCAAPPASAATS